MAELGDMTLAEAQHYQARLRVVLREAIERAKQDSFCLDCDVGTWPHSCIFTRAKELLDD